MAINSGMYNRPMTEEEERMMMSQSLRGNNNMMMADNNTAMPESQFPADYTTGPTVIPPDADMSQFNDVTGTMLAPPMDSAAPIMTPQEQISPMGTPMTPEQIDEEIMRLQMLKNQMMMGN
tara:strand:+ start:157 stop:519 length:363 start_codon:yes stop_codon:yes gene_type:complete